MLNARVLVLLLFFLSGAAGLVYEVVWTRQLSLIFGISVFAVSAVLAAYMGGLALGSMLFGRWVDRHRNPVRTYAWLEIGIGISALAVPFALKAIEPIYLSIANVLEGQFLAFNFARATLAVLVLLVPTTLMGATLPLLVSHATARSHNVGRSVGMLYFANTLGAAAGAFAAGMVLLGMFGLAGTVNGAAVLNLLLAVAVITLWRAEVRR